VGRKTSTTRHSTNGIKIIRIRIRIGIINRRKRRSKGEEEDAGEDRRGGER
jgi:hypothetical protein